MGAERGVIYMKVVGILFSLLKGPRGAVSDCGIPDFTVVFQHSPLPVITGNQLETLGGKWWIFFGVSGIDDSCVLCGVLWMCSMQMKFHFQIGSVQFSSVASMVRLFVTLMNHGTTQASCPSPQLRSSPTRV